jgi:hypothetical protein
VDSAWVHGDADVIICNHVTKSLCYVAKFQHERTIRFLSFVLCPLYFVFG